MTALPLLGADAVALREHAARLRERGLQDLFASDPRRAGQFTAAACGLELDFSPQLLDGPALEALLSLASAAELPAAIRALLDGESVNNTEARPALHSALRAPAGARSDVDAARALMQRWTETLRAGEQRGFSGEVIRDVVNIGIGGSDLGPRMVSEALRGTGQPLRCHFISNVDPADLRDCLENLDPAQTLFIICSKSFRTEETRVNAEAARRWLRDAGAGDDDIARHFLAVSSNLEAAADFGIPAANCLPMWDWVGGRYSLWSAIGLSISLALGWDAFEDLLAGAAAMDTHAAEASADKNLAILCALIDCWNTQFLAIDTLAVLPYSHRLRQLPDYLQQLVMESNGKGVDRDGGTLPYPSSPVLWGSAGTIGQHSFHQLLHQGTAATALELLLPLSDPDDTSGQHDRLVAHCLAQSSVFIDGRSPQAAHAALLERGENEARAAELAPHLAMPGSRLHSLVTFQALDARTLGALLALWEHRTYLNAVLLGINAFDQWGVELGKEVSGQIRAAMQTPPGSDTEAALHPGARRHLQRWRALRNGQG